MKIHCHNSYKYNKKINNALKCNIIHSNCLLKKNVKFIQILYLVEKQ